jgi:hypothetical protein
MRPRAGGDPDPGDTVTVVVDAVTQDEPVNGLGDGDMSPDAQLTSPLSSSVALRAERSGTGDGRVYRLHVTATDSFGAACETTALTVGVPRDQGKGSRRWTRRHRATTLSIPDVTRGRLP